MTEITTFRLRIKGQVQNVGFRDWALNEALNRKLNGWVRNRRDGTVELMISGPDAMIQQMLGACTQGPEPATVTNIEIFNETELPEPGFVRKPTL